MADLLRQAVYSRLAGYEDVNDAERLAQDPTFRLMGSERIWERGAALTSRMSHSPLRLGLPLVVRRAPGSIGDEQQDRHARQYRRKNNHGLSVLRLNVAHCAVDMTESTFRPLIPPLRDVNVVSNPLAFSVSSLANEWCTLANRASNSVRSCG